MLEYVFNNKGGVAFLTVRYNYKLYTRIMQYKGKIEWETQQFLTKEMIEEIMEVMRLFGMIK